MIPALLLIPAVGGLLAFFLRHDSLRRGLLMAVALAHTALTLWTWRASESPSADQWLALDAPGRLFLSITSVLFLAAAFYATGYLRRESRMPRHVDFEGGSPFANTPEAVFTGCLLLFLATMTLVCVSLHIGVLWVAVEATTLASAPLIYFHRHTRSLEAAWKYLLLCSVGIALALLGNFFLAAAHPGEGRAPMLLSDLIAHAPSLRATWLKAAFLLFLVGYGTKMGLAPLHTWLPDAHSEAPSAVSALLSGALLNCAFLAILRAMQVCVAAGQAQFAQELLLGFGLISMALAAIFLLRQADFKRMLAYSSVEHMGILAFGIGLGGLGAFGSMLHAVNHSLAKAGLFLLAGNILTSYQTKSADDVRGVSRMLPWTGLLWVVGFLAITGTPPFGLFMSEFTILKAAIDAGRPVVAAVYLACLALAFIGMATVMLRMAQGEPRAALAAEARRESWTRLLPSAVLMMAVLVLGLYLPERLTAALHDAARGILGGL